jgi:dTDP-4-amino-4,6-dideoxygalactose transaminase
VKATTDLGELSRADLKRRFIPLGTVEITDRTVELITGALREGRIGQGPIVAQFERELAQWFGVQQAVAVANGTIADAVALAALKTNGASRDHNGRHEVILPALTFIAQANAVYYNHLTPVFVDVGEDYQIDVEQIEAKISPQTLAIMPTHLLGRPAPIERILALAHEHNLWVIEDACEALGSRHRDRLVGTFGDMGCFSFFVSHSITTGEGGVVVTDNPDLAEKARSLRNHGRQSEEPEEKFQFPHIGFSGKMNQLEAAVGLGAMQVLDEVLTKRRSNMLFLNRMLGDHFVEGPDEHTVPHGYPVQLADRPTRDRALTYLHEKGIECRPVFSCIPTQVPAYAFLGHRVGEFPVAERIGDCGLYVPCQQNLTAEDLHHIARTLQEVL